MAANLPIARTQRWHHLRTDEVVRLLNADLKAGLSAAEVKLRQEKFGLNVVRSRRRATTWIRFLQQLNQPLVYVLVVAGGVTALVGEWVDSSVIFTVVVVNAVVGFLQEGNADKAIEALSRMVVTETTVRRDGWQRRVRSESLVPGDVVLLKPGDRVPADLRLFHARSLQVDESPLTGESTPVHKHTDPLALEAILADRRNLAFAGTLVTAGQGEGVVWASGDETETGRIAGLVAEAVDLQTPLTRKIAELSWLLLWVILGIAAATFTVGVVRGEKIVDMFMAAVALAVGAIPEGLPAALTIVLAIGVTRMAKRRAIIRSLSAVETLGSTTIICSDKTGTLTENQMTVQEIFAGGQFYEVTGAGYEPTGEIRFGGKPVELSKHPALAECLRAGLLCNDSQPVYDGNRRPSLQGDPTEAALVVVAEKAGLVREDTCRVSPRLDMIPFESEQMFRATLHGGGERKVIYKVGAVERLLDRSTNALGPKGELLPLDKAEVNRVVGQMAERGLRVLAFVRRHVEADHVRLEHTHVAGNLTFLGLQGMIDPPRPEVIAAVRRCQQAGIVVKMITGDHAITARAIARRIGLGGVRRVHPDSAPDFSHSPRGTSGEKAGERGNAWARRPFSPQPSPPSEGREGVHPDAPGAVCGRVRPLSGGPAHDGPSGDSGNSETRSISGYELENISDDELPAVAEQTDVFARVAPEQKLRLVRALQSRGHVVAMTGDGVNDAPALKQADIGVAMGISGTDVAKGAADMILTDDNFTSIEAAVEEGRGVFDNLTKFIVWILPTNVGEALLLVVALILGLPLPLLPLQLLWINFTDTLLGLPLAFEPQDVNVMRRPPRQPQQPLLTFSLLMRTGLVSLLTLAGALWLFAWEMNLEGGTLAVARTTVANVIVLVEAAYLFNCRSLRHSLLAIGPFANRWAIAGAIAMLGAQLLFTYVPLLNRLFHTAPIGIDSWLRIVAVAGVVFVAVEVEKWIRFRAGHDSSLQTR